MQNSTLTTEPARLLAVDAVAALLQVSTRHVYRMADAGRMPRPLKIGGANRWDRSAIESWILDGCRPITSTKGGRGR